MSVLKWLEFRPLWIITSPTTNPCTFPPLRNRQSSLLKLPKRDKMQCHKTSAHFHLLNLWRFRAQAGYDPIWRKLLFVIKIGRLFSGGRQLKNWNSDLLRFTPVSEINWMQWSKPVQQNVHWNGVSWSVEWRKQMLLYIWWYQLKITIGHFNLHFTYKLYKQPAITPQTLQAV